VRNWALRPVKGSTFSRVAPPSVPTENQQLNRAATPARKSGETRRSSGPVRLSDPGFQASSEDAETPTQGQGSRSSSASAQGSRRTKPKIIQHRIFSIINKFIYGFLWKL
jgi:hypothetical protein